MSRIFITLAVTSAAVCSCVLSVPWAGRTDTLTYMHQTGNRTGKICDCLALREDVPVYRSVCGSTVTKLSYGKLYRTLDSAPIFACKRTWVPLLVAPDKDAESLTVRASPGIVWLSSSSRRSVACTCQYDTPAQHLPLNPSPNLASCICQVESNCDPNIGCRMDRGSLSCGPFQIKEPYWIDASRFAGHPLGGDWKNCTTGQNNMACSLAAFIYYVGHYGASCAKPDAATDEVYARVHNGGPRGCKFDGTIAYWNKVKACLGTDTL